MGMSRNTTFLLKNGIEEIIVGWDSGSKEVFIKKQKILENEKAQVVSIQTNQLEANEWLELSNAICECFGKLFADYKVPYEYIPGEILDYSKIQINMDVRDFDDDDDDDEYDDRQRG